MRAGGCDLIRPGALLRAIALLERMQARAFWPVLTGKGGNPVASLDLRLRSSRSLRVSPTSQTSESDRRVRRSS